MERTTRLLIAFSAAAAIGLQSDLGAHAWPNLLSLNATLFVVALVLARAAPAAARWFVLLPAYVFPVLIWRVMHGFDEALWSVWTSMLLGYLVGRAPVSGWALPQSWRWPLAVWGLSVAVSWPIIVWREIDFTPTQLDRFTTSVTNVGISPATECLWIAHVAATHLLGILWVDALARDRAEEVPDRRIVAPLLASMVLSAGLAVYQMFGHIQTLNPTIFGATNRAAGAMLDGNAFGMATALWVALVLALSARAASRASRFVYVAIAAGLLLAVWGSGSQSAFFSALVGVLGAGYGIWRSAPARQRLVVWASAAAIVVAVGIAAEGRVPSTAVGPLARFEQLVRVATHRDRGGSPPVAVLKALWSRDRYGTASTAMIRQFPVTGVGVGMFNTYVLDESLLLGLGPQAPDNAQNWFRHQLAEMGVVGSVGWIVWLIIFIPALWRRPVTGSPVAAYALRGGLVGLGLASLIAMPTQNTAVLITFWAFVWWTWTATRPTADSARPVLARPGLWWAAAVVLVVAYAGAVWRVGVTRLRVPERAATLGWPYDHGFYDLEKPPSGSAYRWTAAHAVVAIPAPGRDAYLPLTFWVHHPDVRDHPVRVRIWVGGRLDVDMTLANAQPVTRYVRVHAAERGVMVETEVDRTWRPASSGAPDSRNLGLAVADWAFICCPPPGAVLVN